MSEIKTAQPMLREISIDVNGTGATPAASGSDMYLFNSITDNGVGDYTLNLSKRYMSLAGKNIRVKSIVPIGDFAHFYVNAVTTTTVNVKFFAADGTTAKDCDFSILLELNDAKFLTK